MAVFSELVLEHFRNPRNSGELESATHRAEVTNPVCGDVLQIAAIVENGRIVEARFLCRGCTTAIACASVLCERITGMKAEEARSINAEWISKALGNLPEETKHGAILAADGVKALLRKA
jgi:nitrogen fixation protein NifU and related proteins